VKTDTLKVARIQYLNTDPFFAGWDENAFPWVSATPRQLGQWAESGALDAGPIPIVDFWRVEAAYEPVRNFGIAATGPALSVLLFTNKDWAGLDGAAIGVTDQSATSVQLLNVLLKGRHGVEARFVPLGEKADAELLIGDDALRGRAGFSKTLDLGHEWFDWKKRPFVFARWVVRRTAPAYWKEELAARLDASLRSFEADTAPVVAAGAKRLGFPPARVRDYLKAFAFRLGENEEAGATLFRETLTGKATRCLC